MVHAHQPMCLLAEVLLVEVLPPVVLLALVGKMVLAASGLLEKKEKTPPGLEYRRRRRSCHFLALGLCPGTLGAFSFLLAGLGGIGTLAFSSCRCTGLLLQKKEFVSINTADVKVRLKV